MTAEHRSLSPSFGAWRLPDQLTILHVLDHSLPLHSGYTFRSDAILREQRRRGWRTCHLTTPKHPPGPPQESIEGLVFYRSPPLTRGVRSVPVLAELTLVQTVARRIEEIAAIERPHLLHAHSPVLNALACLRAARALRLPVAYEVRAFWEDAAVSHGTASEDGVRYRSTRALENYAMRRCSGVATICEGLRDALLARGIASDRVFVIPNGVDIDEFKFDAAPDPELRAALGLTGKCILAFIGSFYQYEGLDLLLSALPLVLRERRDIALLLVGGGPEEDALKRRARSLGIEDAVRFAGRVPHFEVLRYYDLAEILIYPRHRMRLTETVTPLKPLEAMARGRIVLVSDVGGHRELVREGETGIFFRAGDRDALSQAILAIVARPEKWEAMRVNARRYVERQRSWASAAAGYEALYTRMLSLPG